MRTWRTGRPAQNGSRDRRPRQGLTLLELLVVLFILGLLAALVPPSLEGATRRWRLRGAACQVESTVGWARNAAAAWARPVQVLYDVPAGLYWVRAGEESLSVRRLPEGVRFESVEFANGLGVFSDVAAVTVSADGTLDSHRVVLAGAGSARLRLAFNRFTGEATCEEITDAGAATF